MTTNRRSSPAIILVLLLFILAAIVTGWLYLSGTVKKAEALFGLPSEKLSSWDSFQLGLQLGWRGEKLFQNNNKLGEVSFNIESGQSIDSILNELENRQIIQEVDLLISYLLYTGLDRNIQAGEFVLANDMSAIQIANALLDPNPGKITLSILAGWRMEEIAETLASAGFSFDQNNFLANVFASSNDYQFLDDLPSGQDLEGYFIAGNYEFERDIDSGSMIQQLLLASQSLLDENLIEKFSERGFNIHQALTLASIIEREAIIDEEMPLIASVFFNRLAIGMRLESDPSVQYGYGYDQATESWWVNPITFDHLAIQSPYNTYLIDALPPGPIASPSMAAIAAVANPDESPYYFFQAACDNSGLHVFALSFEEHLQNNCP